MLVKDIRKDFGLVFFNRVVSRYCQSYGYIPSKKLRSGKFPTPTLPSWLIRTIYSDLVHIFICTTNDWGRVDIRCFQCTVSTPDRLQEAFRAVYYVTGRALCSVLCYFVLCTLLLCALVSYIRSPDTSVHKYVSMPLQLTSLTDVLRGGKSVQTTSNSLQSGLISVVLKGFDTFFELPRAENFFLELEDVVCMYVLIYLYVTNRLLFV